MSTQDPPHELQQLVDVFWETIPPLWREIHAHLHTIATEEFDVSVEQFHVLRHVRQGSSSVSQLAREKRISRSAISQVVDTLVKRGLIQRRVNPADRRQVFLELTEAGNAVLDSILLKTRQWTMKLFSPLNPDEVQQITHSLERLQKLL